MSELVAAVEASLAPELPREAGAWRLVLGEVTGGAGGVSVGLDVSGPGGEPARIGLFLDERDVAHSCTALVGWCRAVAAVLEGTPAASALPAARSSQLSRAFAGALKRKGLASPEDFTAWFLEPKQLGQFLPIDPAWLSGVTQAIDEVLTASSSMKTDAGLASIDAVALPPEHESHFAHEETYGLCVTLRLIIWDEPTPGTLSIRDVKEQDVSFLPRGTRPAPDRVRAFMQAWCEVLPRHLARIECDVMMPHDLVPVDVLAQVRPQTKDDFVRALIRKWKL